MWYNYFEFLRPYGEIKMEETKQQRSNIPVPKLTIDRQGKVLSANEYMSEVFLYEGIVGGDVFMLTGYKASDLFGCAESGRHPLISRNNKVFKIIAFVDADNEDILEILFSDVTVLEDLKDRYNEEKPCIAKVQVDNFDDLIEAQGDDRLNSISATIPSGSAGN